MLSVSSKTINLHAFSLYPYNLPTFQKATLKVLNRGWFRKKIKWLMFYRYDNNMNLIKDYIRIK
jgi:hypothetical protein